MTKARVYTWIIAFASWIGITAASGSAFAQVADAAPDAAPSRGLSITRSASPLGSSRTVSYDLPVSNRQAIRLSGGYDELASFPKDDNFKRFGTATMKLRVVPVGIDYVVHLADPNRRIVPVASIGAAVTLGRLSMTEQAGPAAVEAPTVTAAAVPFTALVTSAPERHSRMGVGYDVHASLGLRANVSEHLFVIGQARVRHLDALGFSQDDLAQFDKLDFSVGVGFKF
jgi:hypothetical protein